MRLSILTRASGRLRRPPAQRLMEMPERMRKPLPLRHALKGANGGASNGERGVTRPMQMITRRWCLGGQYQGRSSELGRSGLQPFAKFR
jgi:hypothetical protein